MQSPQGDEAEIECKPLRRLRFCDLRELPQRGLRAFEPLLRRGPVARDHHLLIRAYLHGRLMLGDEADEAHRIGKRVVAEAEHGAFGAGVDFLDARRAAQRLDGDDLEQVLSSMADARGANLRFERPFRGYAQYAVLTFPSEPRIP